MTVADVHTQDITPYFNPSYDYIEEARASNSGAVLLVTCCFLCGITPYSTLFMTTLKKRELVAQVLFWHLA